MIYTCINHPLPGLVHIFVNNDSHLSLNQHSGFIHCSFKANFVSSDTNDI